MPPVHFRCKVIDWVDRIVNQELQQPLHEVPRYIVLWLLEPFQHVRLPVKVIDLRWVGFEIQWWWIVPCVTRLNLDFDCANYKGEVLPLCQCQCSLYYT